MQNPLDMVSREDMENAKNSRQASTHPADFAPGMGDDIGMDDFGSDIGGMDGGMDFGGGLGGGGLDGGIGGGMDSFGGGIGGLGGFGQPQAQSQSSEDKFFEVVKIFFKGFSGWFKKFVLTFKSYDVFKRMRTGRSAIFGSIIFFIIGLVVVFLNTGMGFQILAGSMVSCAMGVLLFLFSFDAIEKSGLDPRDYYKQAEPVAEPVVSDGNDDDDDDDFSVSDFNDVGEEVTDNGGEDDWVDEGGTFEEEEPVVSNPLERADEVLEGVQVDRGMVTRQYLFETVSSILPSCSNDYDVVKTYDEESDEFNALDALVKKAANLFRTNQEDSPNLVMYKDKLMYVQLNISRVKWIKNVEQLTQELVNMWKYDEDGNADEAVYGTGVQAGDQWIIKIYKGGTALVSVLDAYRQCKDFILNPKNKIPVVLGFDAEGKVVVKDLAKIHALCVSGMPRSGKTWLVQSMLTQMMMYLKPSELQFYIFDPKDRVSDFKLMQMPHIKEFKSKDEDIVKSLKYIVKTEGTRRMRIIGDADCVNIDDFKKKCPDVEMPLLYVIIDEVITFATRMKDENVELYKEFQSYLKELVSRLPNVGIRLFMIPHVIKNDIIQKTTTDLIPCRISVKGSPQHIESVTGFKQKDFPYALTHSGDMAVLLDGGISFCHAAVLSDSNEGNNEIFNFLTRLWLKIEPESIEGSVYQRNHERNVTGNLLRTVDSSDRSSEEWGTEDSGKEAVERTAPFDDDRVDGMPSVQGVVTFASGRRGRGTGNSDGSSSGGTGVANNDGADNSWVDADDDWFIENVSDSE